MPTMQTAQMTPQKTVSRFRFFSTTEEPASDEDTAPPNMRGQTATLAPVQQDQHDQQHAGEHQHDVQDELDHDFSCPLGDRRGAGDQPRLWPPSLADAQRTPAVATS